MMFTVPTQVSADLQGEQRETGQVIQASSAWVKTVVTRESVTL